MSTGSWLDSDGLYRQYGTSKAIPEAGGDYVLYGDNREIEVLINLGATSYGSTSGQNVQNPPLPSSFQGTVSSQTPAANTGIVSFTTKFPLQQTAPVTVAGSDGVLKINNPQLWIDMVEVVTLVTANPGTGGATGLTGIGLVVATPSTSPSSWVQVTPNTGVQLLGSITNAAMTTGATYTFRANANNAAATGGAGYIQYGTASTAVATAGSWLGNAPLVTNVLTPLPVDAYISAIAAGGTYTGASGGGLIKLRIKYCYYGTISY